MFKFKISKAEWEKLSDEQKALYTAKGDDYQFQVEGMPDIEGMQTKLDKLLDETKTAKQAKADAEAKAKADLEEAARKAGNTEALDKSYGERIAQMEAAHKAELGKYQGQLSKLMVTNEAQALATKLFGKNAALLQHHIVNRLSLEQNDNGEFKTRIIGVDGKPTAHTMADLEKEFTGREDFKSFLVTTKATGATGALENAETHRVERKQGTESLEDRKARAREIAAQDANASGNQY